MKIQTEDAMLLAGSGLLGASIGFCVGLVLKASILQIVTIATATATPGILISYQINDNLNSRKHMEAITKLSEKHKEEIEKLKYRIAETSRELARAIKINQELSEKMQLKAQLTELIGHLNHKLAGIKTIDEGNQKWEDSFNSLLGKQSLHQSEVITDKYIKQEIKSIFDYHDGFTQRAMKIVLEIQKIIEESDTSLTLAHQDSVNNKHFQVK